jgi:hypothetical protein
MPHGVANAKQLAMMSRVLEAYCRHLSIPVDSAERDELASTVLALFNRGVREDDALLAELLKRPEPPGIDLA